MNFIVYSDKLYKISGNELYFYNFKITIVNKIKFILLNVKQNYEKTSFAWR
jgi:hypothetical protein